MKRRKGIEDHTDGVDKKIRKQGKGRKTLKAKYVYIVCRSIVIKVLSIASIFLFVKTKSDLWHRRFGSKPFKCMGNM